MSVGCMANELSSAGELSHRAWPECNVGAAAGDAVGEESLSQLVVHALQVMVMPSAD